MIYTILGTPKGNKMLGYYPDVLSAVLEIQALMDSEGTEFDTKDTEVANSTNDAWLMLMGENRIRQWEIALGITPLSDSTLDDRRSTIIARMRGSSKLNTAVIEAMVNAFTGGTANSWITNSTLYVEVTPPPGDRSYKFANLENELHNRIPAHIALEVSRNYYTWGDIKDGYGTWQDMSDDLDTWNDVIFFVPFA